MSSKKYSKIYMIEVRANVTHKDIIEFLIKNLIDTIHAVSRTCKITKTEMDREE